MYIMEIDELGSFITVCCKHCSNDVRVDCKDETEVASWNLDLEEGIGCGVYILHETLCTDCEEREIEFEEDVEKRLDAGCLFLEIRG